MYASTIVSQVLIVLEWVGLACMNFLLMSGCGQVRMADFTSVCSLEHETPRGQELRSRTDNMFVRLPGNSSTVVDVDPPLCCSPSG